MSAHALHSRHIPSLYQHSPLLYNETDTKNIMIFVDKKFFPIPHTVSSHRWFTEFYIFYSMHSDSITTT
jgi:hypothetical protein